MLQHLVVLIQSNFILTTGFKHYLLVLPHTSVNLGRFSASQLALGIVKSDIIYFKIFHLFVVVPLPTSPCQIGPNSGLETCGGEKERAVLFLRRPLNSFSLSLPFPCLALQDCGEGEREQRLRVKTVLRDTFLLAGCLGEAAVHVLTLSWVIRAVWNLIDRSLPSVASGLATSLFALGQELANYSSWAKSSLPPVFVWLTS